MSTTDSPWDDSADLPDWHYASIYGPDAEFARLMARVHQLEREMAASVAQDRAARRDLPAPQAP